MSCETLAPSPATETNELTGGAGWKKLLGEEKFEPLNETKSYSALTDQLPDNAYSTPPPTVQPNLGPLLPETIPGPPKKLPAGVASTEFQSQAAPALP